MLEGAQFTPTQDPPGGTVVVWMHGFTGRFYEAHTVAIGRGLADRGYTFITGNNRGHDLGAFIQRQDRSPGLMAGAWWEDIGECKFDLAAWIGFGCQAGASRVVLAGHSLGAMKAVWYMGTCQDDRVSGLISASGPLRIWQRMGAAPERLATARALVAEGRGGELLPPDAGGRITSAATLVYRADLDTDVYGFQQPGAEAPLCNIRCPILFVLGSEEPEIGRKEDLPTLKSNARAAASTETVYVDGADHVYHDREHVVVDAIANWLPIVAAVPADR
ncbi:MAG: alpha/beta hydrolase [Chloroflexi bacterium]|nr:alpha/beta hydrolase [Chloroflexota bacterium]